MNKVVANVNAAVAGVRAGSTILVGGFGGAGVPYGLLDAINELGVGDLTLVSNHTGDFEEGIAALIKNGRVKKMLASFPKHPNSVQFMKNYAEGKIGLELVPQGTLAERIRAGGAGLGGFYTPTGAGTAIAEGKEELVENGKRYILERPIRAEVAIIRAAKADPWGNLVYRQGARNFNAVMAPAADLTIAEVDEIVPLGSLDPEAIATPGIFVDRVVQVPGRRSTAKVVTPEDRAKMRPVAGGRITPYGIAARAAQELWDGAYVNLGIGMPTLVPGAVPEGQLVIFHSEQGVLGLGPFATAEEASPDLFDPARQAVKLLPGGSYFDHAQSFALIRGKHLDVTILGAFQVSATGDLANWNIPGEIVGGIGGAMDLTVGAKEVWVTMRHREDNGASKILSDCTYPITGFNCVTKIFTDLAFIQVTRDGLVLRELAPGLTVDDVRAATAAELIVAPDIREMRFDQ